MWRVWPEWEPPQPGASLCQFAITSSANEQTNNYTVRNKQTNKHKRKRFWPEWQTNKHLNTGKRKQKKKKKKKGEDSNLSESRLSQEHPSASLPAAQLQISHFRFQPFFGSNLLSKFTLFSQLTVDCQPGIYVRIWVQQVFKWWE